MTGRWIRKSAPKSPARDPLHDVRWIALLAEPYLRGYAPREASEDALAGYWFDAGRVEDKAEKRQGGEEKADKDKGGPAGSKRVLEGGECGFFVGFLKDKGRYLYLQAQTPVCLVFVWLREPGGVLHERLVSPRDSLLRKTHEYIGWLTHRPPRFALFENEFVTMVRQQPLRDWPPDQYAHYARNFFIETLAWLVRSGLVKKLSEAAEAARAK